jgi:hypothetical protein
MTPSLASRKGYSSLGVLGRNSSRLAEMNAYRCLFTVSLQLDYKSNPLTERARSLNTATASSHMGTTGNPSAKVGHGLTGSLGPRLLID